MKIKTRKTALMALFAVIALVIFIVEAQIPFSFTVPGLKPGLANIVTLFMLFLGGDWKSRDVFLVLLTRVLLAALITGRAMTLLYSVTGGICALVIMLTVKRIFKSAPATAVSVAGAITHNIGQLTVAAFVTSAGVFMYTPVLIISGIVSGLLTGIAVRVLFKLHPRFINYINNT
jgi:heptaprenyl diphosphate synthase